MGRLIRVESPCASCTNGTISATGEKQTSKRLHHEHRFVTVSDVNGSEKFYDQVMSVLGFRKNSFTNGGDAHTQYYNRYFGLVLRPAHWNLSGHDPLAPGLICVSGWKTAPRWTPSLGNSPQGI